MNAAKFKTWLKRMPNGCMDYQGTRFHGGYGHVRFNGYETNAQRVAWIIAYGPIPKGLWVLHKCDRPPCCNPKHLFLGTRKDNAHDARVKGRHYIGEKNGRSKLTTAIVQRIRRSYARGAVTQSQLAAWYGVSQVQISQIVRRTQWTHVA